MVSIIYHEGSIFNAPEYAILTHACNTQGSWNAGIASTFKDLYPYAYYIYHRYCCIEHHPILNPVPTGTCLLIPPCEYSSDSPKHWIACLFTSSGYGKRKDRPERILVDTSRAIAQLLEEIRISEIEGLYIGELRMCKTDSNLFKVPWPDTEKAIEEIYAANGYRNRIHIWSL